MGVADGIHLDAVGPALGASVSSIGHGGVEARGAKASPLPGAPNVGGLILSHEKFSKTLVRALGAWLTSARLQVRHDKDTMSYPGSAHRAFICVCSMHIDKIVMGCNDKAVNEVTADEKGKEVTTRMISGRLALDKDWAALCVTHEVSIGCFLTFKPVSPANLKVIVFKDDDIEEHLKVFWGRSASGGRFVFLPTPANPPNPTTQPNKEEARAAAMQQAMPMPPAAAAPGMPPSAGLSTEQIQKYLDENKQLILAILENQNLGKLAECAQYQAQLQKNLLYLAAIADTQPQTTVSRPQMAPPSASPGAGHYMSQVPMFPPRTPLTPQQMQEQQLQQQQAQMLPFAGQMVARPGAVNGMPQAPQVEPAYAAGGASSEPSGTESHRSTGADNDGGSGLADQS
ncbi:hypothetical protein VPH35_082139 [Triticum aestivum]